MSNQFIILDPRPNSLISEISRIDSLREQGFFIVGVEVTSPELARLCDINIDPQHTSGRPDQSAIKHCLESGAYELSEVIDWGVPSRTGWAFVTVRSDLDAVGAIAILDHVSRIGGVTEGRPYADYAIALSDTERERMNSRVESIHKQDTFSFGGWKPSELSEIGGNSELGAIAIAISDFKTSLFERVRLMRQFLFTGEFDGQEEFHAKWKQSQLEITEAITSGETSVSLVGNGNIAVVKSRLRSAMQIGYCHAPVVIAYNPKFRFPSGVTGLKFTIAQYEAGHIDLGKVKASLNALEFGWGGSPTIVGSPWGEPSVLEIEQVVEIVTSITSAQPT